MYSHTLSVQKVIDQHIVAGLGSDGGVLVHSLGNNAHVLLTQRPHVVVHAAFILQQIIISSVP